MKCANHSCRETINENELKEAWISNSHLIRQSFYGYRCKSGIAMLTLRTAHGSALINKISVIQVQWTVFRNSGNAF